MKPLENPHSPVKLKVVARRQLSSPRIVNDYRGAELRSLNHGFNLTSILRALADSLCEKEIYSALFISITALEECEICE